MEMLIDVGIGLVTAGVAALAALAWRNRSHMKTLHRLILSGGEVRVSVAALLRVRDQDRYVLFHTPHTPGGFGPPGGVVKFHPDAEPLLDEWGFREHRRRDRRNVMDRDLRGIMPARRVPAFLRWLNTGENRESAAECLRRELVEELVEAGHPELVALVGPVQFQHVRTVVEGPLRVPGRSYRQLRRHEIYDLKPSPAGDSLRRALITVGSTAGETKVLLASGQDILDGRSQEAIVGPQSAFLLGSRRLRPDLPSIPH
jgi:hypothetical protein